MARANVNSPAPLFTQKALENKDWINQPVYFPQAKLAAASTSQPPNSPADSTVAADAEVATIMASPRRRGGLLAVPRLLRAATTRLLALGRWRAINAAARHFFGGSAATARVAAAAAIAMAPLAEAESSDLSGDDDEDDASSDCLDDASSGGSSEWNYYAYEDWPVDMQRTAEWVASNPYNKVVRSQSV